MSAQQSDQTPVPITASAPGATVTECFFAPRSVAVIGASGDPRKWGHMAAEQLLRDRERRQVYLVNAKGGRLLGERCLTQIGALPLDLDLAIVTVPPAALELTVEQLLGRGVRGIVAITSGFGEASEEGRLIEERIARRVRQSGAALVGPNCMGVFDGLVPFRCMPWAEISPGPVGFVSQSGGLIMDLCLRLEEAHLGLSRCVSIGNQADLTATDFVRNLSSHAGTEIIAVYCEALRGGRELFVEIANAVRSGKPVLLLSPDSTRGARRAALSHTASLVTDRRAVQAAADAAGAHYVGSMRELAEAAQALASRQRGAGRRIAVVTDTGGPGVLLCGATERAGLEVRPLSSGLREALAAQLTARAVTTNPIDLVDNLNVEPATVALEQLMSAPEVDGVLMNLHVFVHDSPAREVEMGNRLAATAMRLGKPLAISCRSVALPGVQALLSRRIPVYRDAEAAARAMALLCEPPRLPEMPATAPTASSRTGAGGDKDSEAVGGEDYASARALGQAVGIEFPRYTLVESIGAALEAAERVGYPVVLKAAVSGHKARQGAVAVGLRDASALAEAMREMQSRLGPTVRYYCVEELTVIADAVEVLIAVRRDPRLGALLVLGSGGVDAEQRDDAAVALLPVSERSVERLLQGVRSQALWIERLGAVRLGAAVHGLCAQLEQILARHPDVQEFELNPILIAPQRSVAIDAKVRLRQVDDNV